MRFDVIYEPKGPAREYSAWACNLVQSPKRNGEGPRTCSHGCLYCYNPKGTEDGPVLKRDVISRLKNDLPKLRKVIKPGEQLEFTFVGDVYDPKLPGLARECLQACNDANVPFRVLTKNGKTAISDFDLYKKGDLFGCTLTFIDPEKSKEWEPGASLPGDRLKALEGAHKRGIKTWASLEPVIDPDETMELIRRSSGFVDHYKVGKWNHDKLADKIDWRQFAADVVELLESLGCDYYIKDDLKPFIPEKNDIDSTLNAALSYASKGWPVFPLGGSDGKKPVTKHGVKDATTEPDIITEWWARWPDANVGIACGQKSFDVVDIDGQKGEEALINWLNEKGIFDEGKADLNSTLISFTAKGKHLCFQHTGKLKNLVRAAEDIDIRTDGGYIVAPPSLHRETGKIYAWGQGHSPDDISPAPFPDWLLQYLQSGNSKGGSSSLFSEEEIKVKEGERNQTLFRQAASARSRGLGKPAIVAMLQAVNATQCEPPLAPDEVERIASSAAEYPPGGARDAIGAQKDDLRGITAQDVCNVSIVNEGKDTEREDLTFSPSKAADVMINLFDLISTPDGLIWIYDDGIYAPDGEHVIGSFLDRIVGDMMPVRLLKETLAKIVYRTREDYGVFNPDPCIFGVQNGVIDMRTGKFSPHSPSWRITRKAPVVYDPSAVCPEIEKFFSSSLAPDDRRSLLEIFAAKTTGLVFEYFAAWVGRGQNGKTICQELIRAFWGDGATTEVQLSTLGKNRFDLAELMNKSWLINSEVGGGQQESRWIKLISGGGKMTADQKGRDHIEFRSNCFIVFDCNNPPRFMDNSHGFKRRLVLLTWPYSFVDNPTPGVNHEKQRDPDLLGKITSPEELSGLLNVLIRIAPKVIESKMIYRRASGDRLAEEYDLKSSSAEVFWDRFCEPDDDTDTPSSWLYQKYKEFCELVDSTPKRDRDFNDIGRKIHRVKKGRTDTPQGRVQAWKCLSFSDEEYNQFLCSWSFRPASDQQETSKKQQQDQQYQQDQHNSLYGLEKEKKGSLYIRGKNSDLCWSGGPAIDYAGRHAGQDGQSDQQREMVQTLSEMERRGDSYNVRNFELEFDLDEGEGAPILEGRGWEDRGRDMWYPPSRM